MRSHINVLAWSDNESELSYMDSKLISSFQELDITPYYPTKNDHLYYFLSSIPTNAGCLPRQETFDFDLKKSVCFDITETNYISDPNGVILNDRINNLPVLKDDWDEPYQSKLISSRNALLISETGGGKTFLLNHLLRQYIENGDNVVLIDLGGALEILSLFYPEKIAYIQYEEGKSLGLNPFLIGSKDELTTNKIITVSDFVAILWKKGESLTDKEKVSLNKIVSRYYRNTENNYDFPSFYNYVKNTKDLLNSLDIPDSPDFFDLKSFVHVCSEFTEGIFEYLFKDNNQVQNIYGKQAVVFQLDSIKDKPSILPVFLMAIRDVVENTLFRKKGRKRIWFEEAAEHLKNEPMLKSIDYYFQTIRKYNGQIGLVLQTIDNIPDNNLGNAIVNNFHIL